MCGQGMSMPSHDKLCHEGLCRDELGDRDDADAVHSFRSGTAPGRPPGATGIDTLSGSGAGRALGLRHRPRLHEIACPVLAEPIRLARSGGPAERFSAVQGLAAGCGSPLSALAGAGAVADAAAVDAWLARVGVR